MIILIDYHSGLLGDAIAAEDHLALICVRDPGVTSNLQAGWRHILEIEFADEARAGSVATGMSDTQADTIVDFCLQLGSLAEAVALVMRCDHGRRRTAAIAKALGEWCGLWVENPGLRYSRPTYQTMRRRIGTWTSPATINSGRLTRRQPT